MPPPDSPFSDSGLCLSLDHEVEAVPETPQQP
jgi:hypothetical protein